MNGPAEAAQLLLFDPCPICMRLAPSKSFGPLSGIFAAGHEACYYAARRWYPRDAERFEATRPAAAAEVAARAERAVERRASRAEWRSWQAARAGRPARGGQVERAGLRVVS